MILDQAISEVQQILGWRSDKVPQITLALQYSQTEREKPGMTFPWWLLQEDIALPALTIGSQVCPLPTNFIQENESVDKNLTFNSGLPNTRTFFLKKFDYEVAEKYYFGDWSSTYDNLEFEFFQAKGPGSPKSYVLRQNSLRIYPIPDQAYVLNFSYWGADAAQQIGVENKWLKNAPWVLIGDAAKKIGSDLGNANAVTTASGILSMAESNLFRSVIIREDAGRRRSMGSRL